jgi:hypothetical protein
MIFPVDIRNLVSIDEMTGEDSVETELLRNMAAKAAHYLASFKWCPSVTARYLGCGVGGVVAVFLMRLASKVGGTDEWVWVVEGDVPSAYFVTDRAANGASALMVYCEMMEAWANAVLADTPRHDVFPVEAPATPEFAKMLLSRTQFIRERIIPKCGSLPVQK